MFATPQTITLNPMYGHLTLTQSVTITGPGAAAHGGAQHGRGTPQFRILGVNSGVTAALSALTITGGSLSGGGAGIYRRRPDAGERHRRRNYAFTTSNGGGIFNNGGTLTLTDSTVSGNTGATRRRHLHEQRHGDADQQHRERQHRRLQQRRHQSSYGTVTLVSSTVSGNSAPYFGGGITNSAP